MVDVRGDALRPPHGITPAAVKANKIQKLSSFKSNENIHKRGPFRNLYRYFCNALTVTCSCCPYLYFGSAIMLVTFCKF